MYHTVAALAMSPVNLCLPDEDLYRSKPVDILHGNKN